MNDGRLKELYKNAGILNPCCLGVILHMAGVTNVAVFLAEQLNKKECAINIEMLRYACLLHDIGRPFNQDLIGHAVAGIEFLKTRNVDECIVKLVEEHQPWVYDATLPDTWEGKLIVFADLTFRKSILPPRIRVEDLVRRYADVLSPQQRKNLLNCYDLLFKELTEILSPAELNILA